MLNNSRESIGHMIDRIEEAEADVEHDILPRVKRRKQSLSADKLRSAASRAELMNSATMPINIVIYKSPKKLRKEKSPSKRQSTIAIDKRAKASPAKRSPMPRVIHNTTSRSPPSSYMKKTVTSKAVSKRSPGGRVAQKAHIRYSSPRFDAPFEAAPQKSNVFLAASRSNSQFVVNSNSEMPE